jgi:hypothetical protein
MLSKHIVILPDDEYFSAKADSNQRWISAIFALSSLLYKPRTVTCRSDQLKQKISSFESCFGFYVTGLAAERRI